MQEWDCSDDKFDKFLIVVIVGVTGLETNGDAERVLKDGSALILIKSLKESGTERDSTFWEKIDWCIGESLDGRRSHFCWAETGREVCSHLVVIKESFGLTDWLPTVGARDLAREVGSDDEGEGSSSESRRRIVSTEIAEKVRLSESSAPVIVTGIWNFADKGRVARVVWFGEDTAGKVDDRLCVFVAVVADETSKKSFAWEKTAGFDFSTYDYNKNKAENIYIGLYEIASKKNFDVNTYPKKVSTL